MILNQRETLSFQGLTNNICACFKMIVVAYENRCEYIKILKCT